MKPLISVQFLRYYGQKSVQLSKIANMPRRPPIVFPQEQRLLSELGERLRFARKRRKLSNAMVAQMAGISRTTLYKVEAGHPGATMGAYVRVLAALSLENDLNHVAADDKGQDLALRSPWTAHPATTILSPLTTTES
ncbi:helix-turn-helix domain-containing protein [Pseudomonas putida]|uniref:helix-turn-helix domain-containing protein n=1 Tax=Pseudomonas putida TaxID=303 RepID=UPI001E3997E5|nr:helix-turn-helix transcriptional regulator [Pseudomonas putida]USX37985.1 helix-turn-helix domain-containing protein [Pseudomonas putida]